MAACGARRGPEPFPGSRVFADLPSEAAAAAFHAAQPCDSGRRGRNRIREQGKGKVVRAQKEQSEVVGKKVPEHGLQVQCVKLL